MNNQEIKNQIAFEGGVLILKKYGNENPTNNAIALDPEGQVLWESDSVCPGREKKTIVSIGKTDEKTAVLISFDGLHMEVDFLKGTLLTYIETR